MPLYSCRCVKCSNEQDYYSTVDKRNETPACEVCGHITEKIISAYYVNPDIESYVDHNLGPKPVRVNSKKHRQRLMREAGVYESYGKGWK